jgi:chromate transporter
MILVMKMNWAFLLDVLWCSLSSFGGPEAHYGIFSQILVQKKKYISEETLAELIGVFSLVPGPSSTQTIMAIGYLVGGKWLALLTFMVWALPAIVIMMLVGIFFSFFQAQPIIGQLLTILPSIAVAFIFFAGWSLSKKVLTAIEPVILFIVVGVLGFWLMPLSIWTVPALLVLSGLAMVLRHPAKPSASLSFKTMSWVSFLLLLGIALSNEILIVWLSGPWFTLFYSFYRYGYSVIGGGQIVIPLMIQDLVTQQSLISLPTFLSGYTIDQVIPGPLFSFAAFVGTQILAGDPLAWLGGLLSGFSIFIPGILLVYVVMPLWKSFQTIPWMKVFLRGIRIAAASLIVVTAINQFVMLPIDWRTSFIVASTTLLLMTKKIFPPWVVLFIVTLSLIILV